MSVPLLVVPVAFAQQATHSGDTAANRPHRTNHRSRPKINARGGEATRRRIYKESVLAEEKALKTAQQRYPVPLAAAPGYAAQAATRKKHVKTDTVLLTEQYKKALAEKWALSRADLYFIDDEGHRKKWPKH